MYAYQVDQEPGKDFAAHEVVDDRKGEYVRGNALPKTMEGFYSQLKRGYDGMHHHVSGKHLHRYASEFDFRDNLREVANGERTVQAIQRSAGKRLQYRNTTRNE